LDILYERDSTAIANFIEEQQSNATTSIPVDLNKVAKLDPTIHVPTNTISERKNILLTGCTGFLGSNLLAEFLTHTEFVMYL
jgi:hypothetical protein